MNKKKPWQGKQAKYKGKPFKKSSKGEKKMADVLTLGEVKATPKPKKKEVTKNTGPSFVVLRQRDDENIWEHIACYGARVAATHKFKVGDFVIADTPKGLKHLKALGRDTAPTLFYIEQTYEPEPYFWNMFQPPIYSDADAVLVSDDRPSAPRCKLSSEDFRVVTAEELSSRLSAVAEAKAIFDKENFTTGDPVELMKDIEVFQHGMLSSGWVTIRKGTSAIIDLAPGKENDDDTYEARDARTENAPRDLMLGDKYKVADFVMPRLGLFFPEMEHFDFVRPNQIKRKLPEFKDTKLVVPDGYMERIMTVTRRVTDKDVHEKIYEQLGLHRVCQKGRGANILLYGPPGTGKTMTAEVLAEMMGRPLLKGNLGTLTDGEHLSQRLATYFKRAKRYNAILLLDEVDVFIRRRGGMNPIFDENTAVFLRVLEYFDGILIMTTNLVNHIDPAVFSRVHVCLEYSATTNDERKAIWKSMFPEELRKVITGDEQSLEKMFDELATVNINGREIKNVIQNVVCRAVVLTETKNKKGLDAIPKELKWISPRLFIDEAQSLEDQRNALRGAEPGPM